MGFPRRLFGCKPTANVFFLQTPPWCTMCCWRYSQTVWKADVLIWQDLPWFQAKWDPLWVCPTCSAQLWCSKPWAFAWHGHLNTIRFVVGLLGVEEFYSKGPTVFDIDLNISILPRQTKRSYALSVTTEILMDAVEAAGLVGQTWWNTCSHQVWPVASLTSACSQWLSNQ